MSRTKITDLLASHRQLLVEHRHRLVALMAIVVQRGIKPHEMGFIVAAIEGQFGLCCLEQGAGIEFLVVGPDSTATMVVPIGVDGLVVILAAVVPEAVEPLTSRAAGLTPILLVDGDDEPAIVLAATEELLPSPAS